MSSVVDDGAIGDGAVEDSQDWLVLDTADRLATQLKLLIQAGVVSLDNKNIRSGQVASSGQSGALQIATPASNAVPDEPELLCSCSTHRPFGNVTP